MADTKYGYLVKTLKYDTSSGECMTMPTGADLEGINLSFAWGYRRQPGVWGGDGGIGHVHPYGECLIFAGLDYDRLNYLGAEIEVAMGDEGEKHVFDSNTLVIAPPAFPHCPVTTRKVEKPFGFLAISLDGVHKTTESPAKGTSAADKKYANLVKTLEMHKIDGDPKGNADYIAGWNGKDVEGVVLNFTWAFHSGTGFWHTHDPHVHPTEEALLFVGLDPDRPDYLGAEIEVRLGEEQEPHVFDKPTVVALPKGLVHCPLITRAVEKPYAFSAISLSTEHNTTWLGGDPNMENKFAGPKKS